MKGSHVNLSAMIAYSLWPLAFACFQTLSLLITAVLLTVIQ